ncbi:hypothetical protein ACF0H5_022458 [Mactra antiquata]
MYLRNRTFFFKVMGILKQGVFLCLGLIVFSNIQSWLTPRLPVVIDGYYHPAFKRVFDKFKSNLESGLEKGAGLAVYHRGVLVVDIWGGYADLEASRPWEKDTISIGFSTTKGVAAIMVAKMVEKGLLDYKRLVMDYWPEFGQNGKDNVTVEMLLSHQAGLAALDEPISLFEFRDNPEKVEKMLASQKPIWPPGTAHGYHAATYGSYVDVLLKKVDPKGRDTAQIFYEDFAKEYDLDMFMNTPLDQYYRVTRLYGEPQWKVLIQSFIIPRYRPLFFTMLTDPDSIVARALKSIIEFTNIKVEMHNNPSLRNIPCSCCYGTGAARGFAKIYSILANGGQYEGKQLLTKESIYKLTETISSGHDLTIGSVTGFSRGTATKPNSLGYPVLGHTGHGGQNAYADLKNEIGMAYLTNHISVYGTGDDPRYVSLEEEVYAALKDYVKTLKKS